MKATFKYLSLIFVSILCSLTLASCGGDDPLDPDDPDGPDEEEIVSKGTFKIGDVTRDIRTVGYYHDSARKGCSFVVSSSVLDFSKPLIGVPNGNLLVVDFPDTYLGKTVDIKEIVDANDGAEDMMWIFLLSYVLDGKDPGEFYVYKNDIDAGTLSWNLDDRGVATGKINATLKSGIKVECEYTGRIMISQAYLCSWL